MRIIFLSNCMSVFSHSMGNYEERMNKCVQDAVYRMSVRQRWLEFFSPLLRPMSKAELMASNVNIIKADNRFLRKSHLMAFFRERLDFFAKPRSLCTIMTKLLKILNSWEFFLNCSLGPEIFESSTALFWIPIPQKHLSNPI